MPDYEFYLHSFLGEEMPPERFEHYIHEAKLRMDKWSTVFDIQPRPGVEQPMEMALCAVAEAMYEYECSRENPRPQSVTVGSVTEKYETVPDPYPGGRENYYREQAQFYLTMGRWIV